MLDESDVQRLMEDVSSDARVYITNKIAGSYKVSQLKGSALIAAEQVFRLLVQDVELGVRVALAQHLKESQNIPRDIIKTLARDVEEVSLPVLEYSEILSDTDLVELLGATDQISKYLAVSKRKSVSETVSDTLLKSGNAQVASTLVNNIGADISQDGFDLLVTQHHDNEMLMKSVGNHPQLPVVALEKLVSVVSTSLGEALRKKHQMPSYQISREIEQTYEEKTLSLINFANNESEAAKLVDQLRSSGKLSPSLILSALCQGNFTFFETCLAQLSSIPLSNARTLIADRGELGFRAIYKKAELPEGMFYAVKMLLQVVREMDEEGDKLGSEKYSSRVIERLLKRAENSNIENLSYVIALVRRVSR